MEKSWQRELPLPFTSEKPKYCPITNEKLFLWQQRYNKSRVRMGFTHAVKDKGKLPITVCLEIWTGTFLMQAKTTLN